MYESNSKGISYTAGFFMLIAFTVAGLILASLVSIPVWTSMTGQSFKEMEKGMSDPANSHAMKVIQSISAVIGFLLPAILTASLLNKMPIQLLGYSAGIKVKSAGLVILIIITALFVSASLAYFNKSIPLPADWKITVDKMEADYNRQVKAIVSLRNTGDYILALVVMALLPAVCEETLFRGGLQNFLTRSTHRPWLSIIIVSLLFSLMHFSWYLFLSRFFLGIVLGLLFQYSGKIWYTIIAHFFNNALTVTILYIYQIRGKPIDEVMAETSDSYWGILFLPVLLGLFWYFRKMMASPAAKQVSV